MAATPDVIAQKWATRLSAANPEITAGVNAVTQAPGQKAAQRVDVWLANLQRSRDKWVRNVGAVSLNQWQQTMITKGIPRISSGATAAIPKMTAFMGQWLTYLQANKATIDAMQVTDLGSAAAKMVAQMNYNAAFVRKPYNLA